MPAVFGYLDGKSSDFWWKDTVTGLSVTDCYWVFANLDSLAENRLRCVLKRWSKGLNKSWR